MMRRPVELVVALLALVCLAPVMAAVALAVRLGSPGPVVFRQERVGRGGRVFAALKFRTMRVAPAGLDGPAVTATGDRRVTTVGRRLRRAKLDELPQLVNVVRGEMALVGPRPEVPSYVALWPADLRRTILSVRPGLTDPVTVTLRSESDLLAEQADPERYYREVLLPHKAAGYAAYVRTRSTWGDLRVLLATVRSVLSPSRDGVRAAHPAPRLLDEEVRP